MTPQEIRIFERIADNLAKIDDSIKSLNDTIKKVNSNTNRNTMLYKVVESIGDVSTAISELKTSQAESNKTIVDSIAHIHK